MSVFLKNIFHAYAQTDGTYDWPNSREGDMLKQAKNEIEELLDKLDKKEFSTSAILRSAGKPKFTGR
jgi:hypothetical protein